ncbi:putative cystathionine gamma-lyase [Actinoplanes sp. NBRC 14428]|uniref:Cystathionine gamma-lyase n=1 Tax=Pseudosporangium ferrugineum TaxID=439699 RepID=A0A2T0SD25_9ACTN|nr:cystathionine gamma-lyase [Pseudosporangium ferrugineum]PRY31223.1 cystathionine gamma-lyase [Pseudosporangium ferrugineum]BCJ54648.1 putative cystathionine gamma-lyase [Actinoplanes sp. NBRC 14428]
MTGRGDGTRVVHAGLPAPVPGEPFLPGPVFAAPYHLDPVEGPGENGYGRPDNPTRRALESAIGELEGGTVRAFASGQAAVTALLLSVLRSGDTVALPSDGYFTIRAFAEGTLRGLGVRTVLVPTAGPYPSFEGVRLVLLETPANPGLDVCDVRAVSAAAHAAGALVAVDNTTSTPLGQRPLELGADVVVASGSKALTGHSDVLLGYVASADEDLIARVTTWRAQTGGVPGAFDCWLAHRSMATLDLRLARQNANAAAVAELLAGRGDVTGLRWPGRETDPSYPVASGQMRRIPGIVSFDLGSAERVGRFLTAAELVFAATSFGGLHTTADRRAQWGDDTAPGFVRLSCGIEDTADLIADLAAALDRA